MATQYQQQQQQQGYPTQYESQPPPELTFRQEGMTTPSYQSQGVGHGYPPQSTPSHQSQSVGQGYPPQSTPSHQSQAVAHVVDEKINSKYISYSKLHLITQEEFNKRINRLKFTSRQFEINKDDKTEEKQTVTQYRVPYQFNYAPMYRTPVINDFHLEAPRMVSETGISAKLKNGYYRYSIMFRFDPQDTEQTQFIKVLNMIYMSSVEHMSNIMDNVDMGKFNPDSPTATFDFIIYYRTEKGKIVPGTRPSWFVDLYNSKNRKTVFKLITLPGKEAPTLEWDDLTNARIDMIPCFHIAFDRCRGNKAKTMVSLDSGVVFSCVPCGTEALNIESATTTDEEAVRYAQECINNIRSLNSKTKKDASSEVVVEKSDGPTFSSSDAGNANKLPDLFKITGIVGDHNVLPSPVLPKIGGEVGGGSDLTSTYGNFTPSENPSSTFY
jgi:hypothetical protein